MPSAVEETAAGLAGNHLVVAGGLDSSGRDRAGVWVLSSGFWRAGPPLPQPVDHAAAATISGTLYVVGGFRAGLPQSTTSMWDGVEPAWTHAPSLPQPRGAVALVSTGAMLIAAGGRGPGGGEVAAVEAWTPGDLAWHELGPLPGPRDHLSGFVLGDLACFAGGRSPATGRVDCVNPASGDWSALPALPAATSGAGAATVAGVPIVGGGENASESGAVTSELWSYDGGSWTGVPMVVPRHGWEGAVLGGRVWACGGGVAPGLHPTAICTSIGFG